MSTAKIAKISKKNWGGGRGISMKIRAKIGKKIRGGGERKNYKKKFVPRYESS